MILGYKATARSLQLTPFFIDIYDLKLDLANPRLSLSESQFYGRLKV